MSNPSFDQNKRSKKIAFVGVGNMGGAMLSGFLKNGIVPPQQIVIYDNNPTQCEQYAAAGVQVAKDVVSAVGDASYIIIALKPSVIGGVLDTLRRSPDCYKGAVFISIAASVPTSFFTERLGEGTPIVRTMPSTPMLVGKGAVAVTKNAFVSQKSFEYVCRLLASIAVISIMEEESLNPVISVNGSSPAYVYLFISAMIDAAKKQGIAEEVSTPLILQTIEGAVEMIRRSKEPIDTLIKRVAAPNGTTLAALESFERDQFCRVIENAMRACTERANEITTEITGA